MLSSGIAQQRKPDGSAATASHAWKPHPCRAGAPPLSSSWLETPQIPDTERISQILRISNPEAMRWGK